jgi:hypothetical protein
MPNHEIIQLRSQIQYEEKLYKVELETAQKFDTLKAIRLRIFVLKQQLIKLEANQSIEGLASMD